MSMQPQSANIFVVHSRFQLLVAQHMLAVLPQLKDCDCWLVLDMNGHNLPVANTGWHGVLQLAPPVGGTVRGNASACRMAVQKVREIAMRYRTVRLFVSDIQWPLNNALYGVLVLRANSVDHRVELCNFPDGIGCLQIVYPSRYQRIKNQIKALLGRLGGAPYFPYQGDIIGLELSDRIYSLLPAALAPLRARCIAIPQMSPALGAQEPSVCLFLGQSYDLSMTRKRFREISMEAARYTRSLGYQHHMYKPHPLESSTDAVEIFRDHGFEIVQDPRTAEEVFADRPVGCVVSYNCSALAHLKLMFGDAVRCVSVLSDQVLASKDVELEAAAKLRTVLSLCGVEVVQ